MFQSVDFFRTSSHVAGLFDQLFFGLFLVKGIPLAVQLALLLLLPLYFWVALLYLQNPRRSIRRLLWVLAGLQFFFIFLCLLQAWDELFVNLRHAQYFSKANNYSFNATQDLEGTVEFLPMILLGWANKWGFPIIDGVYLMCFVGAFATIVAMVKLLGYFKAPGSFPWGPLALVWFAPLGFNASHGFTNSVFTGCLFWTLLAYFKDRKRLSMLGCALLPLIRIEGAFLVFLLVCFHHIPDACKLKEVPRKLLESLPKIISSGLLLAIPFLLLSSYRLWKFGYAVPLPVQYKSCLGNFFYFIIGMRNLVADLASCNGLVFLFGLAFIGTCGKAFPRPEIKRVFLALTIFSFPYYLSGGDWFPSYWARYLFPWTLFSLIAAWVAIAHHWGKVHSTAIGVGLGLVFFVSSLWPISSYWKLFTHLFARRTTMATLQHRNFGRGHYRIQYLSQLGTHLKNTTQPDEWIGSSEIATIMFFAERETYDFLGLVNRELVEQPIRPLPSLYRRYPKRGELPYLIFKRVKPDLLETHQPQYLYAFDFILRDTLRDFALEKIPASLISARDVSRALVRWHVELNGLIEPLYGGLEGILGAGYHPFVVMYENHCSLYFVSNAAVEEHRRTLLEKGFRKEELVVPAYTIQ